MLEGLTDSETHLKLYKMKEQKLDKLVYVCICDKQCEEYLNAL